MNKQLAEYESHKKKCQIAKDEAIQASTVREGQDRKELVEFLTDLGATEIWSNGYAFHFDYADKHWNFVNQTDRICISFIRVELKRDYGQPSGDMHVIDGKPLEALKRAIDSYAYICPYCQRRAKEIK